MTAVETGQSAEWQEVRRRVLAHGAQATAYQILKPGFEYWIDPEGQGVVGYVRRLNHRVVAGNPVVSAEGLPDMLRRFLSDADSAGETVVFFCADGGLIETLRREDIAHDAVTVGLQPEWDPRQWHTRGASRANLRAQCNRARNKGVSVQQMDSAALEEGTAVRAALEDLMAQWLRDRPMGVMGFIVELRPFEASEHRRYYIAQDAQGVAAFLVLSPVPTRNGWFVEHAVRRRDAPNGTIELALDHILRDLAADGAAYLTLGLAPLAGHDTAVRPGHPLLGRAFDLSYRRLGFVYNFDGLYRFKRRMLPDVWVPQYGVRLGGRFGIVALTAVLMVFAGNVPRFLADTTHRILGHLPARWWKNTVGLLAVALLPWTLMLAASDGVFWFGDNTIRDCWVAFDATMIALLAGLWFGLGRPPDGRWRCLAFGLATLTAVDFVLTLHGALRLDIPLDVHYVFVMAGTTAPLLATLVLLGTGVYGVRRKI